MNELENRGYIRILKVFQESSLSIVTLFETSKDLSRFFVSKEFRIQYSIPILSVPCSLAVIPFICNVLPIIWLTDSKLIVDNLDEDFYNCIINIRNGYSQMYPNLSWKGRIEVEKLEKNHNKKSSKLVFFSGGVDAYATLFAHIEEKPILFTLWGADVSINDSNAWQNVLEHVQRTAKDYDLNYITSKTNFRSFINYQSLDEWLYKLGIKDNWWHGIQHSIGAISHSAPLSSQYNIEHVYFGATYTIRERGLFTIASDPRIDEEVTFNGCKVVHDQYEYNRQQKISHIVDFLKKNEKTIFLRVCWQVHSNGHNCGKCEKCMRTIYGLLAEGENPNNYGFAINTRELWKIRLKMKYLVDCTHHIHLWRDIQERCREKRYYSLSPSIRWIVNYDFEKAHNSLYNQAIRKMLKYCKTIIKLFHT